MGAGRKTETHTLGEAIKHPPTVNSSAPAWNLKKKDLGGVIFGCTHYTINECLTNQIFGLPAIHFSYVKNIEPGLPLFLFNYSDRNLHGIYEAASHGRMDINPYGWTENGSDRTPYPAQVRVRIRKQCQFLSEEQYSQILSKNYYKEGQKGHFRFELNLTQTAQLVSLFEISAITSSSTALSFKARTVKPLQEAVPSPHKRHEDQHFNKKFKFPAELPHSTPKLVSLSKDNSDPMAPMLRPLNAVVPNFDSRHETEFSKMKFRTPAELRGSTGTWASLFKENSDPNKRSEGNWVEENLEVKQISKTQSDKESIEHEEECIHCKLQELVFHREKLNHKEYIEDAFLCWTGNAYSANGPAPAQPSALDKFEDVFFNSSDTQSIINQLRQELDEVKAFSMKQFQKTTALEKKLVYLQNIFFISD
ncbi:hypothetical protein IFM89_033317 [Coptis chinensis]|uniref:DCD domain-containing protein n=1 Tax=Coptis chinensis TaxID=261450 RepID=A0A835LNG7_9MAGN|nr:hypothetical protein IFM89_033317 [Coptis chinensis]